METLKDSRSLPYRTEIDGLRAVAVVAVVLGHFFPIALQNGYLGVDVFFVVSGYVITQLLMSISKTNAGDFLLEFYAKRIRRILPALLVVILITSLLTFLIISRSAGEIINTGKYSILGISNLYLLHLSTDYFGIAATSNPFTHTWSLGVEEQFYFLYPLLILFAARINKKYFLKTLSFSTIFLTCGSFAITFLYFDKNPNLVFYSMPTRIWEFGLGAIAWLASQRLFGARFRTGTIRVFGACALAITILLPAPLGLLGQVLVSVSTALILAGRSDDLLSRILSNNHMTWLGLRSYSIYLIHWPILVISNYLFGLGLFKNLFFIPLILLLGSWNFKYIETPFRKGNRRAGAFRTILIGITSIALMFASLNSMAPRLNKSYNNLLPRLFGVPEVPNWVPTQCSGAKNIGKLSDPLEKCLGGSRYSKKAFVYLVGDSHADQLEPMVKKSFSNHLYFVKNINLENGRDFPFGDFGSNGNSASLEFIKNNAKKRDVVILTFHRGHLNPSRDAHIALDKEIEITETTRNLMANLENFSKELHRLGVKIILVKDTPLMNSIQTSESCALQNKILGSNGCTITNGQDLHTRYLQDYAFDYVASRNRNVVAWDPFDYVYKTSKVFNPFKTDGSYTMWDWNHITPSYSVELAPIFQESIRLFLSQP
jgi:peptidoglycan/LPS O-acetylase OafA/YrhL